MLFCINTYQCHLQIVAQAYAWPGKPTPVVCKRCDNCLRHSQDKPELQNAFNEIKEILDIVEMLCANFTKKIRPADVVDIFCHPIKSSKPKILKNSDLATLALTDLVARERASKGRSQKLVLLDKKVNR
ncbi:3309_t:CDS:2 [Dentiscutata heterogama]|uniref:3309_t:CDS:1 n=1 Tax=Dentiscutata heterogama TaxID=1316150 RepID=A0ACA9MN71_9GLOM|nr:3309_t:CDS:2 [Dentiscutata heterogama]